MEQLVIVLLIAVIGLVKWLMEKSAEIRAKRDAAERLDRAEPPAPPVIAPRPIAKPLRDSEAAARRLREALGLPEEHELPKPRPVPQEAPPSIPFSVEEIKLVPAGDLERRMVAPPLPRARVATARPVAKPRETPPARHPLDDLLRSRDGLRRAILAQEILGTPKGLVF